MTQRVVKPSATPITIHDVKANSYITTDDQDGYLLLLIEAAVSSFEDMSNRCLVAQTWDEVREEWPRINYIQFVRGPLMSVESVTYTLADGTTATLDPTKYVVDTISDPGRIWLKAGESWPSEELQVGPSIRIRFDAGYGYSPDDIPAEIRQWLLREVGSLFEQREFDVIQAGTMVSTLDARRTGILTHRRHRV